MKRFIRYLYEYEQGRRLRNVGFVKAEQGGDECTLHIHGKGLHMKGERKLTVYLFFADGDGCVGIWQGTVDNVNPAINYRLYFTEEDVGGSENFRKINGIVLESELGHKYAAVWDDSAVNIGKMRVLDLTQESAAPEEDLGSAGGKGLHLSQGEGLERFPGAPHGEEITEEQDAARGDEKVLEQEQNEPEQPEEDLSQNQAGRQEEGLNQKEPEQPEEGLSQNKPEQQEEDLSQKEPEQPEEGLNQKEPEQPEEGLSQNEPGWTEEDWNQDGAGQEQEKAETRADAVSQETGEHDDVPEGNIRGACQCTKIQRSDLARLPRCEWKWANNSFLLHGYYNYRHLALLNEGNRYLLGVPGIYHPQEAKAASVFGFTEFIPIQNIQVDLTDDEKNSQEQFGYWCRPVKRPLKM